MIITTSLSMDFFLFLLLFLCIITHYNICHQVFFFFFFFCKYVQQNRIIYQNILLILKQNLIIHNNNTIKNSNFYFFLGWEDYRGMVEGGKVKEKELETVRELLVGVQERLWANRRVARGGGGGGEGGLYESVLLKRDEFTEVEAPTEVFFFFFFFEIYLSFIYFKNFSIPKTFLLSTPHHPPPPPPSPSPPSHLLDYPPRPYP